MDDLTTPTDLSGDLANELVTSTNVDFALLLTAASDGVLSCEDGYATEWDYVVACYDGCTQPTASFAVGPDCDNEQFSITVNLTAVGSTGTVSITNDGGAPAVTATAIGTYTVGPFDSQDEVNVEVVGASLLCSWTSPKLTYDCTGVGIAERAERTLRLYPNPSEGMFRLELPEGSNGSVVPSGADLQGRIVLRKGLSTNAGKVFELDLTTLPSGAYMIMMQFTPNTSIPEKCRFVYLFYRTLVGEGRAPAVLHRQTRTPLSQITQPRSLTRRAMHTTFFPRSAHGHPAG